MDKTKKALQWNRGTGLCEPTEIATDDRGEPIAGQGHGFLRYGYEHIRGRGDLDGLCSLWMHDSGAWGVYLPVTRAVQS